MQPDRSALGEAWIQVHRAELQRRYGVGRFVAVFEGAVIDWGADGDEVRMRAERAIRDVVFVGQVPAETEPDSDYGVAAYRRYEELAEKVPFRRRVELNIDAFEKTAELDIIGQKTEMYDGIVVIDGVERRYADHDYRLMVENGIVPDDTELVAGIIYWKEPRENCSEPSL